MTHDFFLLLMCTAMVACAPFALFYNTRSLWNYKAQVKGKWWALACIFFGAATAVTSFTNFLT